MANKCGAEGVRKRKASCVLRPAGRTRDIPLCQEQLWGSQGEGEGGRRRRRQAQAGGRGGVRDLRLRRAWLGFVAGGQGALW